MRMEKTVRDHVLGALRELESGSLKSFRYKLNDCKVKEGFQRIPRGELENADHEDLTKLILKYYKDSYGVELTVSVLKAINENQVAEDLETLLANVKQASSSNKPKEEPQSTSEASSSSSAPKPQVVTFVDKLEEELIARCTGVAPILDGLKTKGLLSSEMYDTILAEKTSQDQMRKLYKCIRGFSKDDKHTLYEILKKTHGPLVRDLENS